MSAMIEERLGRIDRILSVLAEESSNGTPVIVEGSRDKECLRGLGVRGRILCVKSGRERLMDMVERAKLGRSVIILTDFDTEGRRLARYLGGELATRGIKVNLKIWKELRSLCHSEVVGVEDLAGFVGRMRVAAQKPSAEALGRHYLNHIQESA